LYLGIADKAIVGDSQLRRGPSFPAAPIHLFSTKDGCHLRQKMGVTFGRILSRTQTRFRNSR
jgi:hypothetical protein